MIALVFRMGLQRELRAMPIVGSNFPEIVRLRVAVLHRLRISDEDKRQGRRSVSRWANMLESRVS
ncbi:hypothetical protein D8676_06320 [Mesorhizobium sp. YM1C-6-2]|nr:hypothetical protein D8676_06320 [Mesorhizobium sp. YM1C-6-2]